MTSTSTETNDAAIAVVVIVGLVVLVVLLAVSLVVGYLTGRIVRKAGEPLSTGFIPLYNQWKLYELGGFGGWWAIVAFIPVVNVAAVVVFYIAQYRIGLGFAKPGSFVLLAVFLPIVWIVWLALDTSTWDRSRAIPTPARVQSTT